MFRTRLERTKKTGGVSASGLSLLQLAPPGHGLLRAGAAVTGVEQALHLPDPCRAYQGAVAGLCADEIVSPAIPPVPWQNKHCSLTASAPVTGFVPAGEVLRYA